MSVMAAERESPGLLDYVVTALSPALIMLMVGSLVFFLVEVLYAGQYSERLLYTMFFFVFGAVLVARIAIQYDASRAAVYGLGLAVVTYIAILAYVEYPPGWLRAWGWLINLLLLGVIGWSAYQLTWDCTHIDEKAIASGRGILHAAGMDPESDTHAPPTRLPLRQKRRRQRELPDSRLWAWIERYQAHREAQRKAGHTPGVWVVYFAVAALPLFALGQSLIDPNDHGRRWNTFLQMVVYTGSALGLLVTTSLLGVRRYLRQRKARISPAMTASWLLLGGVLIAVFIILGALLPRPHSEVPWFGLERMTSSDREASRYAQLGGASGKNLRGTGSEPNEGRGRLDNAWKTWGETSSKGKKIPSKELPTEPPGHVTGDDSSSGQTPNSKDPSQRSQAGDQHGEAFSDRQKADKDSPASGSKGGPTTDSTTKENNDGGISDSRSATASQLSRTLERVARWAKGLVVVAVIVVIIVTMLISILKYIAPFTDWAQRWLENLSRWWAMLWGLSGRSRRPPAEPNAAETTLRRPPPFQHFSNPFTDGSASARAATELVQYTYAAFEAWAWDHNAGRDPSETPLELAARVGELYPEMADSFHRLASLYTRIAYSTNPLPNHAVADLEHVWDQMMETAAVLR